MPQTTSYASRALQDTKFIGDDADTIKHVMPAILDLQPISLNSTMDVRFEVVSKDKIVATMQVSRQLCQPMGKL
jgi:hypothetical protein